MIDYDLEPHSLWSAERWDARESDPPTADRLSGLARVPSSQTFRSGSGYNAAHTEFAAPLLLPSQRWLTTPHPPHHKRESMVQYTPLETILVRYRYIGHNRISYFSLLFIIILMCFFRRTDKFNFAMYNKMWLVIFTFTRRRRRSKLLLLLLLTLPVLIYGSQNCCG